jgi:hypothetical protein
MTTQSDVINLGDAPIPTGDGEINTYIYPEAADQKQYFDPARTVIFINGMGNSGENHAESALALSLVQMCKVIGVYNKSAGFVFDLAQCMADKNQFNGISFNAKNTVKIVSAITGRPSVESARAALARNTASLATFDLLREPQHRRTEIFAHSQGNLILSNALQAIAAVDGDAAIAGRTVHTFGSPTVNWPKGITKIEHGFTFDPVSWLAGFDSTWSISKVGMPSGTMNPITHAFLEYLREDPAFVVNRFRWGSFRMTLSLDEEGLAQCLADMGVNMKRVRPIFEHLEKRHNSDIDDVAVLYVNKVRTAANSNAVIAALKSDRTLVQLLIRAMDEGWTTGDEKKAIDFLKTL